jgi:M6 family metalloprotease-like protein
MLFNQLNLTSLSGATVSGSLRDYFRAVSYNKLDLQVDVFGPYQMPNNVGHYALRSNCSSGGNTGTMVRLAIDSAYVRGGANYADYTIGGSTTVNTVHIIFAGYGTEAGATGCNSIWSHASSITAVTYNGIRLNRYSCSPELRNASGTNITHIGVVAHELAHSLLNLPDFYDTRYSGAIDLGAWCLMASGSWNDGGRTPPFITAWGRVAAGWVPEIILSTPQDVVLPSPATSDAVYRYNTTTPNEYFLIENRLKTGWDSLIPASGMLIYHVDRTSTTPWNNNQVMSQNSSNRRRYYIKQAGGNMSSTTPNRIYDPWPQPGRTSFTDESTPNSKSWAGNNTEKPITDIVRNANNTISFKFMHGAYDVAVDLLVPAYVHGADTLNVQVKFRNHGSPIKEATIEWNFDGQPQTPFVWNGSLAHDKNLFLTLGSVRIDNNTHSISVNIKIPEVEIDTIINKTTRRTSEPFFTESFENTLSDWVFVNGTETNKWIVGTATSTLGSQSVFLSNDGVSQQAVATTRKVHFYRDITFPQSAEDFVLYFDFQGMGIMSVYIGDTTSAPVVRASWVTTGIGVHNIGCFNDFE